MVHRPSYPYLVSFEKINLFLVLVLSGSLTISISNFVQWIQSSMPILSPIRGSKKKKIIFPIHPSGSYAQAVYEKKKIFFFGVHPPPGIEPTTIALEPQGQWSTATHTYSVTVYGPLVLRL